MDTRTLDVICLGRSSVDLYGEQVGGRLEDVDHVREYMVGSLLSGGGSDPATNSFEDWRALYEMYQSKALETRLGIPLLYGVDAVHGHSNVIGAVVFPHNIGLGATRNAELVEEIARITAALDLNRSDRQIRLFSHSAGTRSKPRHQQRNPHGHSPPQVRQADDQGQGHPAGYEGQEIRGYRVSR